MSQHDNITNESSDYPDTSIAEYITSKSALVLGLTLTISSIILFTGTLIFIAISWIKIVAWRQFKNYVFLNLTLSLFLINTAYAGCIMSWPCCGLMLGLTYRLGMSAFSNWVLVMCMVIYTKILKVFSGNLQHKYHKANAFAWGLAVLECVPLHLTNGPAQTIYVIHAMTYVIIGFYISILYALLKLTTVRMVSSENTAQIIKIFVYVTSAFGILLLIQTLYYFPSFYDLIFMLVCGCQFVFIISYLTMKSHWDIWDDYIKGKIHIPYQEEINT